MATTTAKSVEPGVQLGESFVSQAELLGGVARAARGLVDIGIGRNDSVALMLRNDVPFIQITLAARHLGAYPVPLNWHLQPEEIEYILQDADAKALVVHEDFLDRVRGVIGKDVKVIVVSTPAAVRESYGLPEKKYERPAGVIEWSDFMSGAPWDQPAAPETSSMIYTSGTTGRQKGVRRNPSTPEQFQSTLGAARKVMGIEPGIRSIIPAPLYHSAPNFFAVMTALVGGFQYLMPRFDPEEFLGLIEKYQVTHVQMVPVMFVRLLKLPEDVRTKYDLSSLQHVVHAAAPCPHHIKKAMIDWWGPVITEYYGSTEMGIISFCNSEQALQYPGTVGSAIDGVTIKVFDEEGNERLPGEIGRVFARCDWYPDFTYQNDEAKRRSIEMNNLYTGGDVGYLNEAGFLFLCDRANDMVISGGVNIYPAEIEATLIKLPGVRDCAVFGIPDDEYGEVLAAVIEREEGADLSAEEVSAYLREHLAGFKVPRVIEFRKDLPREDSGKLFKRKLREPYWEKAGRKI